MVLSIGNQNERKVKGILTSLEFLYLYSGWASIQKFVQKSRWCQIRKRYIGSDKMKDVEA